MTPSLEIPADVDIRRQIRMNAGEYVRMHPAFPPASWEDLSVMARALTKQHALEERYLGFVMLCCGNAVWHPIVGAVPFERRILLLPQCLKNSRVCRAEVDEFGLLCNECGKCTIAGLIKEAEGLGYKVIVSEGTTLATRLIESGQADAVLGVGCMEVLQKIFGLVNTYAVPGIGVPLLTCGCSDTTPDPDWIREELHHTCGDDTMRLVNLDHIRKTTLSLFHKDEVYRLLEPGSDATLNLVTGALLAGGQRLRPFIAVATWMTLCPDPDPEILVRMAFSVECFHKASLIHDDVEDEDPVRYGKLTLHARYNVAVAINAGDLLIGEGYRILAGSRLSPATLADCVRVIAQGHRDMAVGQGAELLATSANRILSLTEVLEIFRNKTASAFRVSLLLGGIMGGAGPDTLECLERFSHFAGIAYQVKDDLEDYPETSSDNRFRKPSVMLAMLMEDLGDEEWRIVEEARHSGRFDKIDSLLAGHQTADRCKALLKDNLRQARESIAGLQIPGLKLALYAILGKIFGQDI